MSLSIWFISCSAAPADLICPRIGSCVSGTRLDVWKTKNAKLINSFMHQDMFQRKSGIFTPLRELRYPTKRESRKVINSKVMLVPRRAIHILGGHQPFEFGSRELNHHSTGVGHNCRITTHDGSMGRTVYLPMYIYMDGWFLWFSCRYGYTMVPWILWGGVFSIESSQLEAFQDTNSRDGFLGGEYLYLDPWGNDPIWWAYFSKGWNQQVDSYSTWFFVALVAFLWISFPAMYQW